MREGMPEGMLVWRGMWEGMPEGMLVLEGHVGGHA